MFLGIVIDYLEVTIADMQEKLMAEKDRESTCMMRTKSAVREMKWDAPL